MSDITTITESTEHAGSLDQAQEVTVKRITANIRIALSKMKLLCIIRLLILLTG